MEWNPTWLQICLPIVLLGHFIGLQVERMAKGTTTSPTWPGRVLRGFGLQVVAGPISGAFLSLQRVTLAGAYLVFVVLAAVLLFAPLNSNPFIYFQF